MEDTQDVFDLGKHLRTWGRDLTQGLAITAYGLGLTADALTWLGLGLSAACSLVILFGANQLASFILLLSGVCDMIDGAVATLMGGQTKRGTLLDSVLDRPSDALPLIAIGAGSVAHHDYIMAATSCLAMLTTYTVSYIKARGEGLGCQLGDGLMSRAPRIILLVIGLYYRSWVLLICLALIFAGGLITAIDRMQSCNRQLPSR